MRGSERWLRERAEWCANHQNKTGSEEYHLEILRKSHAPEVARIDAAEARFEACSARAKRDVHEVCLCNEPQFVDDAACYASQWEALADVAEGIDRRARTEGQGEGPTDVDRMDWLDAADSHLSTIVKSGPHACLRAAIDSAMAAERGREGRSDEG